MHFAPSTLGAAVGNVSNASAGAATQDVAVSGIGTGITASAASLVFGNQLVGTASATQTYTVQAEGLSANLLISAPAGFELSTTGGAPWFASLNLGTGTIAPTLISVRFVPLATGAAGGNVSNISTGFVTRDVSVSGNGVAGVLNIAGTQNHGSVPVTQNGAAILYTISNVAAGPTAASLTVNSVTLGGANPGDFALSAFSVSLPTVLAPGTSFTFLGTFTPLTQGVRNADIVINSNTGGEPPSNSVYPITGTGTAGLFAATPTFPAQIDNGGPVVVSCVISALANTTADIMVEYIGGSVAVWTPAVLVRTNAGSISGNVITGMSVLAAGSTLEIFWDAYASERHITAANYQIRFTPSNGIYGTGTIGTSVTFSLARDGGWAKHSIPVDYLTGRIGQSSVFDAANDRLVVFAGAAEFMQLNDVWAYDRSGYAQGWHRINAAGTPPAARQYPVSVYDAANQRMLVFGGWNSSLGVFNDTWSLSLTRGSETWAQLAPAGGLPAARHFHAAALDLARNRMLMFGGKGASGNLGDIWELTLNLGTETWTQLAPTGTAPTARNGAQMVVDVPRDRLVIYGGDTGVNVSSTEVFALSLATPPGAWSNLLPATPQGAPVGRHMAAYGYCDNRQSMLVVAGYRTGGAFNTDSWLLDLNGSPTWTPLSADPDALQGRCHGTTGYDAARGQLMVFGGINKYAKIQDSLSILDTNATPSWQTPPSQSALADTPGQRNTQSMVFDTRFAPNGRVVVFGGNNLSNSYNDVWYLDPSLASPTWIKLNPSGTPPSPRGMCAVAYDNTAGSEKMIVFGGVDYNGVANNEVWILDLSNPGAESWSKVVVAGGPTPRTRATAVVDPNGGSPRLLVFGGDGSGRRNDVWSLNLTGSPSWTLLLVLTGPSPAPRFGHGMTLDSAGNRLIIYYGNCAGGFLQDTWAFNLTLHTWTDITQTVGSKPTGRENFPTASALAGTRAYLHAGLSGSNVSDLWRLDVPPSGTVTWTQVNFTGAAPLARHHHSVCIDSTGRLISGFGYVAIAANKAAADIWAIDPLAGSPAWQQLQTSSEPRGSQHAASGLDAANGRMIVFGGLLGGVLDGRLWQLSLNSPIAAWSELNAGGAKPAPRRSAKFVYDPVGNRMLMYGGYVGSYYQSISDEMWQLTLTPGFETWTQLSLGGGPPGLADYSVVYDPVSHSAVYFGGQLNTGGGTNVLWRLALGSMTWSTSTATTKPVARYGHSAIYDSVSARMIMFAGKYGGTDGVNDLWSYNIAADSWTQLAVAGTPGGRYFHSAVFDSTPGQERMIVFCGFSNGARSDAWTLDLRSGFPLAWSPLTSTVALPQPRWAHNAVFDAANLRMVLAGGYTNGEEALQEDGKRADTWFYGR
ncbi:MAG: choice-of-anchor D domain-containing protein [Planctomycetes bacterium]|nr:choice-of-anchor D domain-containing protein [Planctomycetota bacterium]